MAWAEANDFNELHSLVDFILFDKRTSHNFVYIYEYWSGNYVVFLPPDLMLENANEIIFENQRTKQTKRDREIWWSDYVIANTDKIKRTSNARVSRLTTTLACVTKRQNITRNGLNETHKSHRSIYSLSSFALIEIKFIWFPRANRAYSCSIKSFEPIVMPFENALDASPLIIRQLPFLHRFHYILNHQAGSRAEE